MAQFVVDYLIRFHGFKLAGFGYSNRGTELLSPCQGYQICLWDSTGSMLMDIKEVSSGDTLFKGYIPTSTDSLISQVKMILKFTTVMQ